ncbi:MAG: HAD family hydrolase [Planctomycetota bacterium]|jgi:beta-phosphoglucomutase
MLRAVIFDFDGVITDTEIVHLRAFNNVLAPYDIEITTEEYYKDYLGLTDVDCFRMLADEGQLKAEAAEIEKLVKQKNEIFEEMVKTNSRIIGGVVEFLSMLKQNSVRMAICSGALLGEIELILKQAQLGHFFEAIVSADQIEKGKPDPEGYLLALERLNQNDQNTILPDECIVIEDSHWGLEAAKAAGMHTVAVTNTYSAEELGLAEKIVARLDELTIDELGLICA